MRGAKVQLIETGIAESDIDVFHAAGAFEIPLIAQRLARSARYAGVICLGAIIEGDTAHFEFISLGATVGVMHAMLQTGTPISFGILTTYTDEQAIARSSDDEHNKGREAAAACIDTVRLLQTIADL